MPLAGKGMLLTSMDIDAAHEEDFNRWYDREHLEERVAIDGFLEARRYVAHAGSPQFLFLYSTRTIEVLDSPPYRARLSKVSPGKAGGLRSGAAQSGFDRPCPLHTLHDRWTWLDILKSFCSCTNGTDTLRLRLVTCLA